MKGALLFLGAWLAGCAASEPPPRSSEVPKAVEAPKAAEATKPAKATPKAVTEAPKAATPSTKAPPKPPAPASAAAPLDLKTLEQRLKGTSAIGVLTKLSLKNQVDDLVARFRAYHGGTRPPTLGELRPAFELLLMKVLSLLQDKDTALARDINASREAIWAVLSDRDRFHKYT